METITLNNGVDMPALGLGVFQTPPRRTVAREDRPPLISHPLMQQVLVQIQLKGNLGHRPIPVDDPMRGLHPILRGKRTPTTRHLQTSFQGTTVPLSQMSTTSGEPQRVRNSA